MGQYRIFADAQYPFGKQPGSRLQFRSAATEGGSDSLILTMPSPYRTDSLKTGLWNLYHSEGQQFRHAKNIRYSDENTFWVPTNASPPYIECHLKKETFEVGSKEETRLYFEKIVPSSSKEVSQRLALTYDSTTQLFHIGSSEVFSDRKPKELCFDKLSELEQAKVRCLEDFNKYWADKIQHYDESSFDTLKNKLKNYLEDLGTESLSDETMASFDISEDYRCEGGMHPYTGLPIGPKALECLCDSNGTAKGMRFSPEIQDTGHLQLTLCKKGEDSSFTEHKSPTGISIQFEITPDILTASSAVINATNTGIKTKLHLVNGSHAVMSEENGNFNVVELMAQGQWEKVSAGVKGPGEGSITQDDLKTFCNHGLQERRGKPIPKSLHALIPTSLDEKNDSHVQYVHFESIHLKSIMLGSLSKSAEQDDIVPVKIDLVALQRVFKVMKNYKDNPGCVKLKDLHIKVKKIKDDSEEDAFFRLNNSTGAIESVKGEKNLPKQSIDLSSLTEAEFSECFGDAGLIPIDESVNLSSSSEDLKKEKLLTTKEEDLSAKENKPVSKKSAHEKLKTLAGTPIAVTSDEVTITRTNSFVTNEDKTKSTHAYTMQKGVDKKDYKVHAESRHTGWSVNSPAQEGVSYEVRLRSCAMSLTEAHIAEAMSLKSTLEGQPIQLSFTIHLGKAGDAEVVKNAVNDFLTEFVKHREEKIKADISIRDGDKEIDNIQKTPGEESVTSNPATLFNHAENLDPDGKKSNADGETLGGTPLTIGGDGKKV